jgi:hypothetical protein
MNSAPSLQSFIINRPLTPEEDKWLKEQIRATRAMYEKHLCERLETLGKPPHATP